MTHHLHAHAAAWALDDALTALHRAATAEAAQIAAERLAAPDCLRSPAWGRRHALGGHGDPTATVYLTGGVPGGVNRAQALHDDLTERVAELARHLPSGIAAAPTITGTGDIRWDEPTDPLARIRAAIPRCSGAVLDRLTEALTRLDEVARRHLRLPPARELLSGQPCPECRVRDVWAYTAGPVEVWTVGCGACGRAWPRAHVLSAVGGVR